MKVVHSRGIASEFFHLRLQFGVRLCDRDCGAKIGGCPRELASLGKRSRPADEYFDEQASLALWRLAAKKWPGSFHLLPIKQPRHRLGGFKSSPLRGLFGTDLGGRGTASFTG